jgi:transcription elongation factor GreA
MVNVTTKKGMEALQKKLEEKLKRLKNIQEEKAHAYNASGDGWHDNPGWTQLGQQEEMVSNEIGLLQKRMSETKVIEISNDNVGEVQIGVFATYEQLNKKTGKSSSFKFLIATEGEADIKKGIISNNSPLGSALIGMKKNETKTIQLPSGEFDISVTDIMLE